MMRFSKSASRSPSRVFAYLIFAALLVLVGSSSSSALVLSDSMSFQTLNQSMWGAGGTATLKSEVFLGEKWGTYSYSGAPPVSASIGGIAGGSCESFLCIDTRTGAIGTIETSGQVGIKAYAQAKGGGIDIRIPVSSTLWIEDNVTAGNLFRVSTAGGAVTGTQITAKAPSFNAGINGVFDVRNKLSGSICLVPFGCAGDSVNLNVLAGEFQIIDFDTSKTKPLSVAGIAVPIVKFGKEYDFYRPSPSNPDGVDDEVTPQKVPTPYLGSIQVDKLNNKTGGVMQGGTVSLDTYQKVLTAQLSLTGFVESLLGSPGLLKNETTIIDGPGPLDIKAGYTIADVAVGPIFGMKQEFDFTPHLSVKLEFDKPVTRMESVVSKTEKWVRYLGKSVPLSSYNLGQHQFLCSPYKFFGGYDNCMSTTIFDQPVEYVMVPVVYDNGIVTARVGDDFELMFDSEVGRLVNRSYYLDNSIFSNKTSATVDPSINIQLFCAELTGVGELCAYDETFATTALLSMNVFNKSWTMGGFSAMSFASDYELGEPPYGGGVDDNGGGSTAPVPEPASIVLFFAGVASLLSRKVISRNHHHRKDSEAS